MLLGKRIKQLRNTRKLSAGEIAQRTGLSRPYISRIENEHTIPSIETLEKLARAFEIPLYRFFVEEGEEPSSAVPLPMLWKTTPNDGDVREFRPLLAKMTERDRGLLLSLAHRMARRNAAKQACDQKRS